VTTRNVELFDELIATLEKTPDSGFNMSVWQCGTVACIGGHLCWMYGLDGVIECRKALGIDSRTADDLFFMENAGLNYDDVTKAHAIRVVKHLRDTGIVDWDGTRHEPQS
jgi:hypothetical protein